jgi:hypothetical protein
MIEGGADAVQRILGAHEARLTRLESDGADMRKMISDFRSESRQNDAVMQDKLDNLHDMVIAARGGWKAISALGGITTIVSGVAIAIYHFAFQR